MDDQLNENTEESQLPPLPPTGLSTPAEPEAVVNAGVDYASFLQRFLAALIDVVIIATVMGLLSGIFGKNSIMSSLAGLIGWVYPVFMIVKYGATIGKMALKIKVQDETTGENLDVVNAILREVVGKFISSMVFLLGFLWMLWDDKKQCWHDKLGKSIVVKAS